MTPYELIAKRGTSGFEECSESRQHSIDLWRMPGDTLEAEGFPTGGIYCLERGARKARHGNGRADAWNSDNCACGNSGKCADFALVASCECRARTHRLQ